RVRVRVRVRVRARAGASARRQRGSLALMAIIGLVVAVAALGVLDVANVYLAKRSLQNVADLAALAAAQQMDDLCSQPQATALANAASNGFVVNGTTRQLVTKCGRWDSNGNGGMTFVQNGGTPPLNGVWVHVTNYVPYFFLGKGQQIAATATAKASVIGSFQLGTSLVEANLLNGMLGSLLGTNVKLSLVSWSSIANANVTLGQLAKVATSAGTVNGLLNTSVSVSGLAQLMIDGLQRGGGVVSADAAASIAGLQAFVSASALNNVQIPIAATGSSSGLLSVGLADAESAANVSLNALQALIVAAEVAQQGKAPVGVNVDLSGIPGLSSLIPLGLALTVNVLSPPSIAVGEAGDNPDPPPQWRTYAHNAQVTVLLSLGLGTVGIPGVLSASVNLPLYVEGAQATAGLASTYCGPTAAQSRSIIDVLPGIANLCLGSPPTSAGQTAAGACGGAPSPLADVTLFSGLGSGLSVDVGANLSLPLANTEPYTLTFDGNGKLLENTQTGSSGSSASTSVGDALGGGLTSLGNALSNGSGLVASVAGLPLNLGTLVGGLVAGVLAPIASTLDTVLLGPLLQLLGVQLGVANITDFPLSCGVATLVQ
ncbi:MAG TPA: TadG family pilus assembly protein, partial [Paraburkholderia sp.]|nr:TadG family pilus assembly protein [Paraburkholderia sp.]